MSELKPFSRIDIWELFDVVLWSPEYISDYYYRDIAKEIQKRFDELKKEHYEQTTT